MQTFYTYLWLREDGTPYYVGKGTARRAFRKGRPQLLDNIVMQEQGSEEEAFFAETFMIAFYGRKDLGEGRLHNRTDGGEGVKGKSAEQRATIGAFHRGHTMPTATREALRRANTGRPCPTAVRTAIGNRQRGRPMTAKARAALDAANKGRPLSAEHRAKMRAASPRRKLTDEHKAKLLRVSIGRVFSPEHRLKISLAKRARDARSC